MAEMSFGARRHTAVRKSEVDTPTFNIQALLQGCVAARPEDSGDATPLIVDFPDRPAKMLAAVLPDYGPASRIKVQLCDLPRLPLGKLKSTEVVVEVHSASINPTDCKQRKGLLSQIWPLSLPCILGIDLAGRVVRAGEDAPFSEGDEVFGRQQLGRMVDLNGSYAEYCIVEAADIYRKPSRLSMDQAAAVPYACLAAYAALAHVGKLAEKRKQADKAVLVLGGSGGVGTFAVQLAKHHFGCFVMASCSEGNLQLMKDLGADEAVDYHDPSFLKAMGYTKFDVIVDTVGGDDYWSAFNSSLKDDGVFVTTVGKERRSEDAKTMDYSSALQYRADYFLRQAFNSIGAAKNYHILTGSQILSSDLRIIASIFEKGTISPVLDSVYSLYDIAKAHEKSETHHAVGKLVIQVRKGGQSQADHSEEQEQKTAGLQARMQGVLANKALGPSGRNTASALANSRGKVQFNGLGATPELRYDDSEDDYPDFSARKPVPRAGPASQVMSSSRDLLGDMTFGAPGVTTTASNPLSGSRPGTAPGTGLGAADNLQNRLEQLQKEVMESTARVQALKTKNANVGSGLRPAASTLPFVMPPPSSGRPDPSKLDRQDLRMGKGLQPHHVPAGLEEIDFDDGGKSANGLDPHSLEAGLKALQAQRERKGSLMEEDESEHVPDDNPFRPPVSKGSFGAPGSFAAPPSTDGADPATAAKRAAAMAKLREMTLGKGLDDPRFAAPNGMGPADSLLGGPPGGRNGEEAGGMSAAALREARMKAEMLKAKQMQQPLRHPADDEESEPEHALDQEEEDEEEEKGDSEYHPGARAPQASRESARMGQGLAAAPERGGADEATAWFKEAKLAAGRGGAPGGGAGGGPKPYAVRTVDTRGLPPDEEEVHLEMQEEDEAPRPFLAPPPPQPQLSQVQRPAGAKPRVRINESPDTREIPQNGPADDDDDISRGGADSGGGGSAASGEILCEGLLRRKKEDHGRFEDPYKMVCVCRLQGSVLRVRLTHNGEVVGLEEQFDLHKDWRLMPRSDKPGRFSLNRIRNSSDNANTATFKADNKDEGNEWIDSLMKAQSSGMGFGPGGANGGGGGSGSNGGGISLARSKQDAIAARMEAAADKPIGPPAGVGMVLKETKMPGGETLLAVKTLAPGSPAITSGMISAGDYLLTVDGKSVTSSAEAAKHILGERGSSITMQFERDGERFVVAMRRGTAAVLKK